MTCACKDSKTTPRSDSQLNYEQEQYLVDLLNRDYSEDGERSDAGQMKCKVGKPCNGRCIPQNHKCGAPGGMRSAMNSAVGGMRSGMGSNLGKGLAAGAAGLALAGGAALAHNQVQKAGGYRNVANSGLNKAEGGIDHVNNEVQTAAKKVVREAANAATAPGASRETVEKSNNTIKGTRAVGRATNQAAKKGKSYVQALRNKVNQGTQKKVAGRKLAIAAGS